MSSPDVLASVDEDTFKAAVHTAFPNADQQKTIVHFMKSRWPNLKRAYVKIFGVKPDSCLAQAESINCSFYPWKGMPPQLPKPKYKKVSTLVNFSDKAADNNQFKMFQTKYDQNWNYDTLPGISGNTVDLVPPSATSQSSSAQSSATSQSSSTQAPLSTIREAKSLEGSSYETQTVLQRSSYDTRTSSEISKKVSSEQIMPVTTSKSKARIRTSNNKAPAAMPIKTRSASDQSRSFIRNLL